MKGKEKEKEKEGEEIKLNENVMKHLINDHCTFFAKVAEAVCRAEKLLYEPLYTKDKKLLDMRLLIDELKHILRETFENTVSVNEDNSIVISPSLKKKIEEN